MILIDVVGELVGEPDFIVYDDDDHDMAGQRENSSIELSTILMYL